MAAKNPSEQKSDHPKMPRGQSAIEFILWIVSVAASTTFSLGNTAIKTFVAYIEKVATQLSELGDAQRDYINVASQKHAEIVASILLLRPEEQERIKPALQDATRNILIEQWRTSPLSSPTLENRPQLQYALTVVPLTFAGLIGFTMMFNVFSAGIPSAVAAIGLFIVGLLLHLGVVKILGRVVAAILGVSLSVFIMMGSDPEGPPWSRTWFLDSKNILDGIVAFLGDAAPWAHFQAVRWAHAGDAASKLLVFAGLVWWASLVMRLLLWIKSLSHLGHPHRSQVAISSFIFKLAQISRYLDAMGDYQAGSVQYAVSDLRSRLVAEIEEAASGVETSWYRSLRTGYATNDKELLHLSLGISQALRGWKLRLTLGGVKNLEQAREAFSLAVLNACDGDWELLSVSEIERSPRKYMRIAKVFLRISLLAATVAVIVISTLYSRALPAGLAATLTTTCTVILVAQMVAILDPSSKGRYETGIKIIELAKK
ncbi:hypothetical protein ACFWYW_48805 [Nonomuraea sp. NPDC059023]|uniref:hypothetical protein n=1 Tax=unclassified Nonomuraea TaxID=2593643 RepID=UPI0036922856